MRNSRPHERLSFIPWLPADAGHISHKFTADWEIENATHCVLDETFRENVVCEKGTVRGAVTLEVPLGDHQFPAFLG